MTADPLAEIERLRRALKRIRDYEPSGPRSEWSQAEAFQKVRQIARGALDPSEREARIRAEEAARTEERRRVGALRREPRYFLHQFDGGGAWVRFLRGDAERDGVARVKVIELVWPSGLLRIGQELSVRVENLSVENLGERPEKPGPDKPLDPP